MKRRTSLYVLLLILVMAFSCFGYGMSVEAATTKTKTREINIVYDDSGSMAAEYQKGSPVAAETKWSQAKYALKVFAAMTGETDTINIYPMSGNKNGSQSEIVTVSGSMALDKRISQVNKINTDSTGGTPFGTVRSAGNDLKTSSADEKWLIVLTDGEFDEFDEDSETQDAMKEYADDASMNVVYIGIGDDITDMSGLNNSTFFSYNGINESKILSTITEVAGKVYNFQPLSLSESGSGSYAFNTDIPVSKFVIFAQGQDISVGDLLLEGNALPVKAEDVSVNVIKGVEKTPKVKNWSDIQFASGLNGHIISYTAGNIPFGNADGTTSYSFSCNTSDVEVYFEPGIDVQAVVENKSGKQVTINSEDGTSLEEGVYKVDLQMINPLNGQKIESGSSDLLGNVDLSVTIESQDTETQRAVTGDTVKLSEGEYTVTTKARFEDDREQNDTISVSVSPSPYTVTFSEDNYSIDPATLDVSDKITFTITNGDGDPLDVEESDIHVSSVNGLSFSVTAAGNGVYTLTPEYEGDGISDVTGGSGELNVTVATEANGKKREGSGSTRITAEVGEELGLLLNITVPEEKYPMDHPQYMFDAEHVGKGKSADCITVEVQVTDAAGNVRDLTESEWKAGQKGFDFKVLSNDGNFIYKYIVKKFCRQDIDFDVELGDEVSSYKLYPKGVLPVNILPHTSEIQISQEIRFKNGVTEAGSMKSVISIQPLGIWVYLGTLIIILLGLVLLGIGVFMYWRKPKFDWDMKPYVIVDYTTNGMPENIIQIDCRPKVHNRFSLIGPEKMTFEIDSGGRINLIYVSCIAVGDGAFAIENVEAFSRYRDSVSFGLYDYEEALEKRPVLNIGSTIMIHYERYSDEGTITVRFNR